MVNLNYDDCKGKSYYCLGNSVCIVYKSIFIESQKEKYDEDAKQRATDQEKQKFKNDF